jgi:N-methylhydantoinase A
MKAQADRIRLAVDIGGTFTDIVALLPDGRFFTRKISSTPADYSLAIIEGLRQIASEQGFALEAVGDFRHATTIGSNAILEHKGARVGLITTRGFRDVLELRRLRMPRLYDLRWEKPEPLVPRYLRREVAERLDAKGGVAMPIDTGEVEAAIDFLLAQKVEVIAVAMLHSYANPVHEQRVREIAARRAPGVRVCLSAEVLPEIREYERTSTAVINGYLLPVVQGYLSRLRNGLDRIAVRAPILIMQSGGGLTTDAVAAEFPVHIVESGPAAGVMGAQAVARKLGLDKVITFDMGGTTAKASIIEHGEVARAAEYQVGAGLMHGSRLLTGAGYLLRIPSIDLAEVGAGGGSHVSIDAGGLIRVGPTSAGSDPGPLCYGLGGMQPTVTDANLLLGYLNPRSLAGGSVALDIARAREMFDRIVSKPLGASTEQAAYAAHMIAASNMIRAIKAVSSERGRDPRDFALVAFGGNGPVFAASIARAMQIRQVVIPPAAGVFSSIGLLFARVERHFVRTCLGVLRRMDPAQMASQLADFEQSVLDTMTSMGVARNECEVQRLASLRYPGQAYELTVPLPQGSVDANWLGALEEAFAAEHERTYGHRAGADEPAELVTLNFVGRDAGTKMAMPSQLASGPREESAAGTRRAYFGPETGWLTVPVLRRADLAGGRDGPFIVEEYDATCLVPRYASASLGADGSIVMNVDSEAQTAPHDAVAESRT